MWITFEGGEGSGKSTQIKKLEQWFSAKNIPYITTREPGGTPEAEAVRNLFLAYDGWSPFAESCLVSTARDHHFHNLIKPALDAKKTVICDRFFDSTIVYQHIAHGIDKEFLELLYKKSIKNHVPDITILLDIDSETALQRCSNRFNDGKKATDRFDEKGPSFFKIIRNGFLDLAKDNPDRIKIINAAQSEEEVFQDTLKALNHAI